MKNKNIFNSIAVRKPKRSTFDLSHDVKLTCNMGELIPVLCEEAVPGDKFTINQQALIRFAPLIAPVMHSIDAYFHTFFVPNRILWDGWEEFITSSPTSGTTPPAYPFFYPDLTIGYFDKCSLYDYLGYPAPNSTPSTSPGYLKCSALPFVAYYMIYNEYYRAQALQQPYDLSILHDGDNSDIFSAGNFVNLLKRGWGHDYFTSALPQAQLGGSVDIPKTSIELDPGWVSRSPFPDFQDTAGHPAADGTISARNSIEDIVDHSNNRVAYNPHGSLIAEGGIENINDLRKLNALQTFLDLLSRGGSRYVEYIKNIFNVTAQDFRLQRPEYVCGSKTPVQVSEVLNTTGYTGQLPQGNMSGHAAAAASGKPRSYFAREHGFFITIMSTMPLTAYQQGLPKKFQKFDNLDYFTPQFENIGEQAILNSEVLAKYDPTHDNTTFGYTPRFAEYKYSPSRVHGEFRDSLAYWHLGRIFDPASPPVLNSDFVTSDPRNDIFAVTDPTTQHLYCHVGNMVMANRPMRKFTIPSLF